MKRRHGIILSTLVAGTLWLGGSSSMLAQDATPVAPDPSECVVEPRTIDNVVDIFIAGDYVPDPEIAAGNLPTGDPAPADAVAGANATLRQFVACANTNDLLAMLALTTDNGAQFFGPESSEATEEEIQEFFADNQPSPVAEEEREFFTPMAEMVRLEDGRIGGTIVAGSGDDGGAVYLIFTEVEGGWLIDYIVELQSTATPTA